MSHQTFSPTSTLNQSQLKIVCEKLTVRANEIFGIFGVGNLRRDYRKSYGQCPVHRGDSHTAFNFFHEGEESIGNWVCYTHNCHMKFRKTILGLIRGLLTQEKYGWPNDEGKMVSFGDTIKWAEAFLGEKVSSIKIDRSLTVKQDFINMVAQLGKQEKKGGLSITVPQLKNFLQIPSPYFISRGYSREILNKYYVGDCNKTGKEMNGRAVVPVIEGGKILGVTGRSVYERCNLCNCHHSPVVVCPYPEIRHIYSKWKHNKGFEAELHLYNYSNAIDYINKSYAITLVESPGNTWKLAQNGVGNVLGAFGCSLTPGQLDCIMKTRANMVNLVFDNDKAGREGAEKIREQVKNICNTNLVFSSANDISDMSDNDVKMSIIPKLKEWRF